MIGGVLMDVFLYYLLMISGILMVNVFVYFVDD